MCIFAELVIILQVVTLFYISQDYLVILSPSMINVQIKKNDS